MEINPQSQDLLIFLEKFSEDFRFNLFYKVTLSKHRRKSDDLKNLIVTPVDIKKGKMLQCIFRYKTKDITKNLSLEEAIVAITDALENDFLEADMYSKGENNRLLIDKSNQYKLVLRLVYNEPPARKEHDRKKMRIIEPVFSPWLKVLGVTYSMDVVKPDMKDKFVQINKYVELLRPEIEKLSRSEPLKIFDMGSGKGYLTFALYDYLLKNSMEAQVVGVEYRPDLVALCNSAAGNAGFHNLSFVQGTINDVEVSHVDVLIALHACDTATDDAIYKGIKADAELIVCAPCCHKQVRKSIKVPEVLKGYLKYGILLDRQAEMVTDGIRALLMELHGYKTRVIEFVSPEHTARNVMIIGRKVKRGEADIRETREKISAIKATFGIGNHYLEDLLGS